MKEMNGAESDEKLAKIIGQLKEKYALADQDVAAHLEGMLYADYLTYWDYIHLDTLLSLQNPKTDLPDEKIFIGYHQITELYLKLILWEIHQMTHLEQPDEVLFLNKLKRVNRYFEHLSDSFDIMSEGMAQDQFLKFRLTLFPASGFQSAQIRYVEFASTSIFNLIAEEGRATANVDQSIEALYEKIYWKAGAMEKGSGKKTLTLIQFEEKYAEPFIAFAKKYQHKNLGLLYKQHYSKGKLSGEILNNLRKYDQLVNVHWRLAHFKSAVKYLQRDPEVLRATGGTNWQKYLPPRFQKISFFPELWSKEELDSWGRPWVMKEVFQQST